MAKRAVAPVTATTLPVWLPEPSPQLMVTLADGNWLAVARGFWSRNCAMLMVPVLLVLTAVNVCGMAWSMASTTVTVWFELVDVAPVIGLVTVAWLTKEPVEAYWCVPVTMMFPVSVPLLAY